MPGNNALAMDNTANVTGLGAVQLTLREVNMTTKSLGNPYDPNVSLKHDQSCLCPQCSQGGVPLNEKELEAKLSDMPSRPENNGTKSGGSPSIPNTPEDMLDRAVENAVVRAVFNGNEQNRRQFMSMMGGGAFAALLASIFPLDAAKAAMKEASGPLEKTKLNIGFVPITCATPIIMAHPLGFYQKYGLDVDVIKTAGWAVARDKSLAREYDASHMLTPMPLAMTLGAGSTAEPYIMPAVENINGQAIVLHVKHKDKRNPKDWKGFKFGVPFDYSMHNFLLRYYVAEHGIDPDKDIQIRVVPPPEMVANLRAGNLDGYLSPDPFNQRAVWEKVGFIHLLTKEIWEGHPCCAFATSQRFAMENPNTYGALLKAIVDATHYSSNPDNRKEISKAIAPKNYLNQPVPVIEQVLTGRYADGLGSVGNVPDRIDFDPFPWHSMAVWILTQMKRWGYVKGDLNYQKIAEEVYLASDAGKMMKELGYEPPAKTYENYTIMGKTFDYTKPEEYINSFAIKRG
ncbi:MAG: ABC transporter substrate-binding protein [Pseudomonadales bacterium]|nr:ABC transporter substrate-binding protein [Pseudomonadales bacterium]